MNAITVFLLSLLRVSPVIQGEPIPEPKRQREHLRLIGIVWLAQLTSRSKPIVENRLKSEAKLHYAVGFPPRIAEVIVNNDNVPTMLWKLGRVLKIVPGRDSIPRVFTLCVANGPILIRPIQRLYMVEADKDAQVAPREDVATKGGKEEEEEEDGDSRGTRHASS